MRVRATGAALILPLLFLVGIGFTMLNGYWRTESSKIPVRYSSGDAAGEYDPGDIRGSYSLEDVEKAFEISVDILARAFAVTEHENPGGVRIKEFEESYGIIEGKEVGTDSMRLFVALYLGRPFTPAADTGLPDQAYRILRDEKRLSPVELAEIEGSVVSLDADLIPESSGGLDDRGTALAVKGMTLFSEILDAGIREEQIVDILEGLPMGPRNMTVRDYCHSQGIEFSGVKAALQSLLDNVEDDG